MAKTHARDAGRRRGKELPAPSAGKEPLKSNVYRAVQMTRTQLAPMFPYFDEGSMVPCSASFAGGPGQEYGRFQHFNMVDEIVLIFGIQGGRRGGGLLRVGPRLHMVHSPFEDSENPENKAISVITQRQSVGQEQREEVRFVCEQCDRRLFKYAYDAQPPKKGKQLEELGPHPEFNILPNSLEAAERFNADENTRTCQHCGHLNPPFPAEAWGWRDYVEQCDTVRKAFAVMTEATPKRAAE